MQRLHIVHRTYYHFSQPVTLGRHYFRLYPRASHELQVESFSINVNPAADIRWQRDGEDNSIGIADFSGSTQLLSIETDVYVKQRYDDASLISLNMFCGLYPITYTTDEGNQLDSYRILPIPAVVNSINKWISHYWHESDALRVDLLIMRLCRAIFENFSYTIRDEPGVQPSLKTLSLKSGSCRDFSLLLIEAARCLGYAARFVSGYLMTPPNSQNYGATHAWVEVYFSGFGWVGFDPTVGGFTSSDNIPVAVAAIPNSIPPVEGVFLGSADSQMDVGVWVNKV